MYVYACVCTSTCFVCIVYVCGHVYMCLCTHIVMCVGIHVYSCMSVLGLEQMLEYSVQYSLYRYSYGKINNQLFMLFLVAYTGQNLPHFG